MTITAGAWGRCIREGSGVGIGQFFDVSGFTASFGPAQALTSGCIV